ncbi:MAG: hypothetical protein ACYDC8_16290 [Gammaproteobacteria bacterium]
MNVINTIVGMIFCAGRNHEVVTKARAHVERGLAGGCGRPYANGFLITALAALMSLSGCASVNTFPSIARAGDTVSVMVGATEKARKETIDVTLKDSIGQTWDLRALGLVRSVFNLRTDGTAYGLHYSPYLNSYISWANGHEPLQTVLVTDLPSGVAPGQATLTINTHINDDSSGVSNPFTVALEIIAGTGHSEQFLHQQAGFANKPVDFSALEPAPHAKITFGGGQILGAVSMVIGFNQLALSGDDINVYVPESAVRGSYDAAGAFGATQRMVYWHQVGGQLYVDVMAPQGIDTRYLQLYLVNPRGLSGAANFTVVSSKAYDVNGSVIANTPSLRYFP